MQLFDKGQKISKSFSQLLTHFSINPHHSLQELVHITQKQWLQQKRKQNASHKTPINGYLRKLFTDLQMVNAIYPTRTIYDYILLLGSDLQDMKQRIAFLDAQIKNGIRAGKIIVLCSDRPLYEYETPHTRAHTECQMIEELIAKMPRHNWPAVDFCESYGKLNADGHHQRATTEDTIKTWLTKQPNPGSCLIISQQPYIGRQNAVLHKYLHNSWKFETIGPQLAADFTLEDMLDTLARWLYQEYQNLR